LIFAGKILKDDETLEQDKNKAQWKTLLPAKKLSAHKQFVYDVKDINTCGVISHVCLSIAPDGGISRMRLWGYKRELSVSRL